MSTLLSRYQSQVSSGHLNYDIAQVEALKALQVVIDSFSQKPSWQLNPFKKKHTVPGLYLWGGVGIGKTMMMDLFFAALPVKKKRRLHFHAFMREIQLRLRRIQGESNPLTLIAKAIAKQVQVLCLDECVVNDIADAMILARFLQALFEAGVVLVTTSNFPPDKLYWQGLQRRRFMPAIELIKDYCQVKEVKVAHDYRLRLLTSAGVFFHGSGSEHQLADYFVQLAGVAGETNVQLNIENRTILAKKLAGKSIWFDFSIICASPRSQMDYLALVKQYEVFFISNIPKIAAADMATITYFILLVDVLYDNQAVLVCSLAGTLEEIYPAGEKAFEFRRTYSRLQEMQTQEYIAEALRKTPLSKEE